MILLAILLCLYSNIIRYQELKEYTNVQNFKDYIKFNHKIFFPYNLNFIGFTLIVWIITKL